MNEHDQIRDLHGVDEEHATWNERQDTRQRTRYNSIAPTAGLGSMIGSHAHTYFSSSSYAPFTGLKICRLTHSMGVSLTTMDLWFG